VKDVLKTDQSLVALAANPARQPDSSQSHLRSWTDRILNSHVRVKNDNRPIRAVPLRTSLKDIRPPVWPFYFGESLPQVLTPAELVRAERDLEAVLHKYPTLTPRGFAPYPPNRPFALAMKSALDKPVYPSTRGWGAAHLRALMPTRQWIVRNAAPIPMSDAELPSDCWALIINILGAPTSNGLLIAAAVAEGLPVEQVWVEPGEIEGQEGGWAWTAWVGFNLKERR
jgi:hypothetical protein